MAKCSNRECENTSKADGSVLDRCARCKKANYCSTACQRANWSTHKGLCPGSRKSLPYAQLTFKSRLREENDKAYGQIIDTFRLRVEDDYAFGQHNHGIYGQDDPLPAFEDYLDRCEAVKDLLMPTWWNVETRQKCRVLAMKSDGDHYIGHAVEKSDIQEYWKDNMMPMQLRMMAENVYGGGYGMGQNPMPAGYQCLC